MAKKWTMADIRACNRAHGMHWFDRSTMKFFRSRVGRSVYQGRGGIYFVSSEQFEGSDRSLFPRKFTVRRFNPRTCRIDTVPADSQKFVDGADAAREARARAKGR